jgi:hypothetical protein
VKEKGFGRVERNAKSSYKKEQQVSISAGSRVVSRL